MNEQQPIDFKSMFQNDADRPQKNDNVSGHIFSIGWYLITMFIIATLVFSVFYDINTFTEEITPKIRISNALESERDYIFVLNNSDGFTSDSYYMVPFEGKPNYTIYVLKETSYPVFSDDGTVSYTKLIQLPEVSTELIVYNVDDLTIAELEANFDIYDLPDTTTEELTSYASSLLNVVIYIILIVPIVWFMRSDLIFDYSLTLSLNKKVFGFVIAGYLYVLFGNIISNLIITFLEFVFSSSYVPSSNQLFIESLLQDDGMMFMILGAVVLGPIVEELVFRKAIFGLIPKPSIALIVSSLIFALIHVFSELFTLSFLDMILTTIPYLTMGLVFGFIYLKYNKNIYIPILVHMLTNLISILGILFIL